MIAKHTMQTTSIDILNMLVAAGLDRDKAEPLATKSDLWRVALTQTGMTVGATGLLLALFQAF